MEKKLLDNKNPHPRDSNIVFDEEPHLYYINGSCKNNTSVTTIIHNNIFPHFDADKVINGIMRSRGWREKTSKYYGMTRGEIKAQWNDKTASLLGTQMHLDIELYYNSEEFENNSKEFKYFLDFERDVRKANGWIPYRTEWVIYDEDLKLCGSIDMTYQVKGRSKKDIIIYDWKRSKNIKSTNDYESANKPFDWLPSCNFWHYSLQLNIYKYMLEKNYGVNVIGMNLLWLHPNNDDGYRIMPVPDLSDELGKYFKSKYYKKHLTKALSEKNEKLRTLGLL